jgi:DNA-binding response OmpR family regulator
MRDRLLGPLIFDPGQCSLRTSAGDELSLSRGDVALLLTLLDAPGTVSTRERLARASGSLVDAARSRSVDMRLSRLRRLLQEHSAGAVSIEGVRGLGCRLALPTFSTTSTPLVSILALGMGLSLFAMAWQMVLTPCFFLAVA